MGNSVRYRNNCARWTIRDLIFLENNYSSMLVVEIADGLGRTLGPVGLIADKLGCRKRKMRYGVKMKWILSVASMPRVWRLGFWHNYFQGEVLVRSFDGVDAGGQSGCFWREEELDILKADYPRMRMSVTACLLGRNTMLVKIMARRLGLKKSRSSEAGFRSWAMKNGLFWKRICI